MTPSAERSLSPVDLENYPGSAGGNVRQMKNIHAVCRACARHGDGEERWTRTGPAAANWRVVAWPSMPLTLEPPPSTRPVWGWYAISFAVLPSLTTSALLTRGRCFILVGASIP
jgi:hypothetical protein